MLLGKTLSQKERESACFVLALAIWLGDWGLLMGDSSLAYMASGNPNWWQTHVDDSQPSWCPNGVLPESKL